MRCWLEMDATAVGIVASEHGHDDQLHLGGARSCVQGVSYRIDAGWTGRLQIQVRVCTVRTDRGNQASGMAPRVDGGHTGPLCGAQRRNLVAGREGARGESGADNSVWVPTGTDRHTLRTPSSTRMGARRARRSLGLRRAHVSDTAPANPRHWRCSIAWHGMNDDVRGLDIQHTRKHRVQAKKELEETEGDVEEGLELKICDGR